MESGRQKSYFGNSSGCFEPRNTQLDEVFQKVFQLDNNTERSQQAFVQSEPMFSSYEAFLKYVESNS